MELTKEQEEMFIDFYDRIEESILDLKVKPNDNLIKYAMTRVDSHVVSLYKQWGIDDTEFRDGLYNIVKESLLRKGAL